MLVLSRREFESLVIGDEIIVTILRCDHGHVRIGIEAPQHINIVRSELLECREENLPQQRFGRAIK